MKRLETSPRGSPEQNSSEQQWNPLWKLTALQNIHSPFILTIRDCFLSPMSSTLKYLPLSSAIICKQKWAEKHKHAAIDKWEERSRLRLVRLLNPYLFCFHKAEIRIWQVQTSDPRVEEKRIDWLVAHLQTLSVFFRVVSIECFALDVVHFFLTHVQCVPFVPEHRNIQWTENTDACTYYGKEY